MVSRLILDNVKKPRNLLAKQAGFFYIFTSTVKPCFCVFVIYGTPFALPLLYLLKFKNQEIMSELKIYETKAPKNLQCFIQECVDFHNREGLIIYNRNKAGEMGNEFTQAEAREQTFEQFVLCVMLSDLQTVCEPSRIGLESGIGIEDNGTYKCGSSGSHLWLHNKEGERIIMIAF